MATPTRAVQGGPHPYRCPSLTLQGFFLLLLLLPTQVHGGQAYSPRTQLSLQLACTLLTLLPTQGIDTSVQRRQHYTHLALADAPLAQQLSWAELVQLVGSGALATNMWDGR